MDKTQRRLSKVIQAMRYMEWWFAMKWFRKDSAEEDQVVAEAAKTVTEGLSDADFNGRVERANGRNLRDQMTVEQAEEIENEGKLRGFGWGRN